MDTSDSNSTIDPTRLALTAGFGLLGAFVTMLLVYVGAPAGSYVKILILDRGPIQYLTLFCFWVTIGLLLARQRRLLRERATTTTLRELLEGSFSSKLHWTAFDQVSDVIRERMPSEHGATIARRRVLTSLDRLRSTHSTQAMADYFRNRSDLDASMLESSYASIRYFIWFVPTLGFIGTVMGIGTGIAGFADIIEKSQSMDVVRSSLPSVTSSLGTAFDTTLLALVLSALMLFYASCLIKEEERLLGTIDDICFDVVCPLFDDASTEAARVSDKIESAKNEIVRALQSERLAVDEAVLVRLPARLSDEFGELRRRLLSMLDWGEDEAGEDLRSNAHRRAPEAPIRE